MATASHGFTEERKTIITKVPTVTLQLTCEEANTLAVILWQVGGSPSKSPRKDAESISQALRAIGIDYDHQVAYKLLRSNTTGIIFNEYPEEDDCFL